MLTYLVVVLGARTEVKLSPTSLVEDLLNKALENTANLGRPASTFTIKNTKGKNLDLTKSLEALGITDQEIIWVS